MYMYLLCAVSEAPGIAPGNKLLPIHVCKYDTKMRIVHQVIAIAHDKGIVLLSCCNGHPGQHIMSLHSWNKLMFNVRDWMYSLCAVLEAAAVAPENKLLPIYALYIP